MVRDTTLTVATPTESNMRPGTKDAARHGKLQLGFPIQITGEMELVGQSPSPTSSCDEVRLVVRIIGDQHVDLMGDRGNDYDDESDDHEQETRESRWRLPLHEGPTWTQGTR